MKYYLLIFFMSALVFLGAKGQRPNKTFSVDGNQYGVWFKTSGMLPTERNKLTRPFIICEGFDPNSTMGPMDVYRQVNGEYKNNYSIDFLDVLRDRGFDIIVLDLKNNTQKIEDNAKVLINLIDKINGEVKGNGFNRRLTVLGVSMGGLIARYALTKMEHKGVDHKVDYYISFDSPHRGANVPLGFQQFLNFWAAPATGFVDAMAKLDRLGVNPLSGMDLSYNGNNYTLSHTAAIEMAAIYHRNNPVRLAFLNSLKIIGEYPKKCRNIAVSMGANQVGQGFKEGDLMLDWRCGFCVIDRFLGFKSFGKKVGFHLKWCPLAMSEKVMAMPGNHVGKVHYNNYAMQFAINGQDITPSLDPLLAINRDYLVPPSDLNIDHAPGAYYRLEPIKKLSSWVDKKRSFKFRIPIRWSKEIKIRFGRFELSKTLRFNRVISIPIGNVLGKLRSSSDFGFSFVPTLSALDINKDSWFYDIREVPGYPYPKNKGVTSFDAIYFSSKNFEHPQMSESDMAKFLCEEISPQNLFIQDKVFDKVYTNTFEANNIFVGKNVDKKANRTDIGNVEIGEGSHIDFKAYAGGSIIFGDGFHTRGGTMSASIDQNRLPLSSPYGKNVITGSTLSVSNLKSSPSDNIPIIIDDNTVINLEEETTMEIIGEEESELKSSYSECDENRCEDRQGVHIQEFVSEVYPNPFKESTSLFLAVDRKGIMNINIFDSSGRKVRSVISNDEVNEGIYTLELRMFSLPSGVYYCKILHNEVNRTIKLIKQ